MCRDLTVVCIETLQRRTAYHRGMRGKSLAVGLLVACHFNAAGPDGRGPGGSGDGGGSSDAAIADAISGSNCVTVAAVKLTFCLAEAPTGAPVFANGQTTIATGLGTGSACTPVTAESAPACVLAGSDVTVPNNVQLEAAGSAVLVLYATDTIQIAGTIDVASHSVGMFAGLPGAGAGGSACDAGSAPTNGGDGGGAGGSYSTQGGSGGNGDFLTVPEPGGSAGALLPIGLHGGCTGQPGAVTAAGVPGAAGTGGGVLIVIAPTIMLTGGAIIDASGAAGGGAIGAVAGGGGGGGAGGLIMLEGATITADPGVIVLANGGGGGGGAGTIGIAGSGGDPMAPDAPAVGGKGSGGGGSGGSGFAQLAGGPQDADAGSASVSAGGGGGGGGAGYVHTQVTFTTKAKISPAPTQTP